MFNILIYIILIIGVLINISCTQVTEEAIISGQTLSTFDVNTFSINKIVCDPLGGGDLGSNIGLGLRASLFYLPEGHRYYTVSEYINKGIQADQHLFFSQVNVPTRMFNAGFPTETGSIIKNDNGGDLFEFFALRFSTTLQLSPEDEEGVYELALLSDDGAIWSLRNETGNFEAVVSNDGDHPTKMGCSPYELNMTRNTQKLMLLDYYQGPRFHISVIPMWRKKIAGQTAEVECNKQGNNYFFNEANSSPRTPYNNLLARGWKPLKASNYTLPQGTLFNPCQGGIAPVIANLQIEDNLDGVVIVRWQTDIPATSQVLYVDSMNGIEQLTTADNVLRTSHVIYVNMLKPKNTYSFQAVSISDSYGKTISDPIILTLQ